MKPKQISQKKLKFRKKLKFQKNFPKIANDFKKNSQKKLKSKQVSKTNN